jgi:TolA-binding protein
VSRARLAVFFCALVPLARADPRTGAASDGIGETPAAPPDAPYVPAQPAATPEESLGRLRAAAGAGRDDQALGEAYDYLRRYPDRPDRDEVALAAAALRLRRGEFARAAAELEPLARGGGPLASRAAHLLGAALNALERDRDLLREVPEADPASTSDRWLALAQVWRAAALDRLGKKEDAAELYRAIAASGQESPVRAYALAAIAADWDRRGHADRARDALARAGDEARRWNLADLRDALALAAANALVRERKLDAAAQAYDDFARGYPESPLLAQALYERGRALARAGRDQEAAESFAALLKARPDSAYAGDAHLQLGQIDARQGRSAEAVAQYQAMGKSSEAKDAGRESLLLAAQVHYNAKHWADAVPLYRRYLKDAPPDDAKTREVEGLLLVCLWQSDKSDPQIAALAAALPENPLVAQIRWDLATKAYKGKDWADAAELFRREIESDPHGPRVADARFFRAVALHMQGKAGDAIDAYRRFARAYPADARASPAWMRLGILLESAGRHREAADAFGRVTGEDAPDAAYDRAAALVKAGSGAAVWEAFATRYPKHEKASWAWLTAAKLRAEKKDDDGAVRDFQKAKGPAERAAALYETGRIHERYKKRAAAKAAYEALQDVMPGDDPARLAGLLRLALILELEDKPRAAVPFYIDVATHAGQDSKAYATARQRLDALEKEKPAASPPPR